MSEPCSPGGRELPPSLPADAGEPAPALTAARGHAEVLAALVGARVFAAVSAVATSEHVTERGLRSDSTAEMGVLLLEVDGQRALPVFSSLRELQRWRPEARPVPLTGAQACRAALDEQASAVVLDPAGTPTVLSVPEVRALASGFVPIAGAALASRVEPVVLRAPSTPVPDALRVALRDALRSEAVRSARVLEGPDGLVLGVVPVRPLPPAELAALAGRVRSRLGDRLPVEGLDLAQVARRGPGAPVLRRRLRRGR